MEDNSSDNIKIYSNTLEQINIVDKQYDNDGLDITIEEAKTTLKNIKK